MRKLFILFLLLIFFGCSNDDSTNEQSQTQDPNATVADNVVVILAENSELISSESELSSGIYKIQFDQTVPEIKTNDIIVGDEGLGFLRKVTSIDSSNNVVTMQTSQANMEDIFGNTSINFSTDLSSFNRTSSKMYSQRTNYERFAEGVSRNQNSFIFNFANVVINSNASANFSITNGSLTFNPTYVFDLDYSFFSLDRFEFSTQNTEFNAQATLNINANANTSLPVAEYVMYENSNTFVRPVGNIPVVVTVFLKLKAVSSISLGGNLSLEQKLEHNTTLSLGASYENNNWTPIAELNTGFVEHPVDLGGSYFNLTESVAIVPEVIIAFYGINGPQIEPSVSGNFGLNVSASTQDWDADLKASVDLSLGASIGILGETLITLPFDSYNIYTQPIWNAPDNVEIVSGNNQTGNQGEQLTDPIKVRVSDNSGLFYLKDVPVYFTVTSGNGTISNQTVLTDDNGFAEINWTLGDNTDPQTVEVTVKKADGTNIEGTPVTFSANSEDNDLTPRVLSLSIWSWSSGITYNASFFEDGTCTFNAFDGTDGTWSLTGNVLTASFYEDLNDWNFNFQGVYNESTDRFEGDVIQTGDGIPTTTYSTELY